MLIADDADDNADDADDADVDAYDADDADDDIDGADDADDADVADDADDVDVDADDHPLSSSPDPALTKVFLRSIWIVITKLPCTKATSILIMMLIVVMMVMMVIMIVMVKLWHFTCTNMMYDTLPVHIFVTNIM